MIEAVIEWAKKNLDSGDIDRAKERVKRKLNWIGSCAGNIAELEHDTGEDWYKSMLKHSAEAIKRYRRQAAEDKVKADSYLAIAATLETIPSPTEEILGLIKGAKSFAEDHDSERKEARASEEENERREMTIASETARLNKCRKEYREWMEGAIVELHQANAELARLEKLRKETLAQLDLLSEQKQEV